MQDSFNEHSLPEGLNACTGVDGHERTPSKPDEDVAERFLIVIRFLVFCERQWVPIFCRCRVVTAILHRRSGKPALSRIWDNEGYTSPLPPLPFFDEVCVRRRSQLMRQTTRRDSAIGPSCNYRRR